MNMTDNMNWEKELELIGDIEKEMSLYLDPYKETYIEEQFNFNVSKGLIPIEVRFEHRAVTEAQRDDVKMKKGLMLEIDINSEGQRIYISNISIPDFMKSEGIDKKIISIVFNLVEKYGYELFIMDMKPSFYESLNETGSLNYNESDDTLRITEDTNLDK